MRAWIFTGGKELNLPALSARLSAAPIPELILAADSGLQVATALGITPDLLVGDLDSLGEEAAAASALSVLRSPCKKDETDTALAIEEAIRRGAEEILLIGGFGGRIDHTLCNLLALEGYLARGVRICIENGANRVRALSAGDSLSLSQADGFFYFGLLALTDTAEVSLTGAAYPLSHKRLSRLAPYAISNEWAREEVTVTVHRGSILLTESMR